MKAETYGYIANSRLILQNRGRFDHDIKSFPDGDVVITVRSKGKRSNEQNRYYWGVVVKEIYFRLKELGNDVTEDMVHDYLKTRFNKVNVSTQYGEALEMPQSTTELNKEEFNNYLEMIKMWAADTLEINIPDPGEQAEIKFDEV
jgi:hypothetical protein